VEAVQTPKGPRQKTICSLGDLSPRPREEWLKLAHKLEYALAGQGELLAGAVPPRDPEFDGLLAKIRGRRRPPARPQREANCLTRITPGRANTPMTGTSPSTRAGFRPSSIARRAPSTSAINSGTASAWATSCGTLVCPSARSNSPARRSSTG
jgi:hypothetical protein